MTEVFLTLLSIAEGLMMGVPIYLLLKSKNHYKRNIALIVIGFMAFLAQILLTRKL